MSLSPAVLAATLLWSLAAQDMARVRASTDLERVTVGDHVTLTLTVEHDSGTAVVWPEPAEALGEFEVRDFRVLADSAAGGGVVSSAQFVLAAYALGEIEVPPMEIVVTDSGGGEAQSFITRAATVTVESVGREERADIREIRGPLEIPRNWLVLAAWVLLVLALVALGYWVYRRYRRRATPDAAMAVPSVPARPAHEVAYEALARLEASGILDRGDVKHFFIEVSGIVRVYLDQRYGIDAKEMTSHDIMDELRQLELDQFEFDLFGDFFRRSDLVKFAKDRPDTASSVTMIPLARTLVDRTRTPDVEAAA